MCFTAGEQINICDLFILDKVIVLRLFHVLTDYCFAALSKYLTATPIFCPIAKGILSYIL